MFKSKSKSDTTIIINSKTHMMMTGHPNNHKSYNNHNNHNNYDHDQESGSKKSGIDDEPVLSLSYLVEDIQSKIQNNFIFVDTDWISDKKHNVDDPNTRQRYATIISDENNSRGYNYTYPYIVW